MKMIYLIISMMAGGCGKERWTWLSKKGEPWARHIFWEGAKVRKWDG